MRLKMFTKKIYELRIYIAQAFFFFKKKTHTQCYDLLFFCTRNIASMRQAVLRCKIIFQAVVSLCNRRWSVPEFVCSSLFNDPLLFRVSLSACSATQRLCGETCFLVLVELRVLCAASSRTWLVLFVVQLSDLFFCAVLLFSLRRRTAPTIQSRALCSLDWYAYQSLSIERALASRESHIATAAAAAAARRCCLFLFVCESIVFCCSRACSCLTQKNCSSNTISNFLFRVHRHTHVPLEYGVCCLILSNFFERLCVVLFFAVALDETLRLTSHLIFFCCHRFH